MALRVGRSLACAFVASAFMVAGADARADGPVVADRVAVRLVAPETGGPQHPRFFTEREVAFFTKLEGLFEQAELEPNDYPERYVRVAVDRLVARAMLSSLMIQRGVEPPELPRLTLESREELAERLGGAAALEAVMKHEGLDEEELLSFLRDRVRATFYVDRAVTPILAVTEDQLREAFRSALHPFKNVKFDDARTRLRRWLVIERLRVAELEFLQSARARIRITAVMAPRAGANTPQVGGR